MNNSETYNLAYRLSDMLREKYKEVYQVTVFPSAWYEDFFEITVRDLHNYDPRPHDIPLGFVEDLVGFVEDFNRTHVESLLMCCEGVSSEDGVDVLWDCLSGCVLPFKIQFSVCGVSGGVDGFGSVELVV